MLKKYRNVHITTADQLDKYNEIVDNYLNEKKYIIPKDFPVFKLYWKKIPLCYFSVGNLKINNNIINFKPYSLRYIFVQIPRYYLNFDYKFSYDFSCIKSIEKYNYKNNKIMKLDINMIKLIINHNNSSLELLLWIQNNFITYNYFTDKLYNDLLSYYK